MFFVLFPRRTKATELRSHPPSDRVERDVTSHAECNSCDKLKEKRKSIFSFAGFQPKFSGS